MNHERHELLLNAAAFLEKCGIAPTVDDVLRMAEFLSAVDDSWLGTPVGYEDVHVTDLREGDVLLRSDGLGEVSVTKIARFGPEGQIYEITTAGEGEQGSETVNCDGLDQLSSFKVKTANRPPIHGISVHATELRPGDILRNGKRVRRVTPRDPKSLGLFEILRTDTDKAGQQIVVKVEFASSALEPQTGAIEPRTKVVHLRPDAALVVRTPRPPA